MNIDSFKKAGAKIFFLTTMRCSSFISSTLFFCNGSRDLNENGEIFIMSSALAF